MTIDQKTKEMLLSVLATQDQQLEHGKKWVRNQMATHEGRMALSQILEVLVRPTFIRQLPEDWLGIVANFALVGAREIIPKVINEELADAD